jgi:hypothetical protein
MKSYGKPHASCECSRCDPNGRDRKRRKTEARRDGRSEIARELDLCVEGTLTGRIRSDRPNVANKPRGELEKLVVLDDHWPDDEVR